MQGRTLNERCTVYDWEVMDNRLRYTAVTRLTSSNLLQIHLPERSAPVDESQRAKRNLEQKVANTKAYDAARGRTNTLTAQGARALFADGQPVCSYCRRKLMCNAWTTRDPRQWTVDDWTHEGHHDATLRLACYACNSSRRQKIEDAFGEASDTNAFRLGDPLPVGQVGIATGAWTLRQWLDENTALSKSVPVKDEGENSTDADDEE